jgi:hypothetical protein
MYKKSAGRSAESIVDHHQRGKGVTTLIITWCREPPVTGPLHARKARLDLPTKVKDKLYSLKLTKTILQNQPMG